MHWRFDIGFFIFGIIIVVAGVLIIRYHIKIAKFIGKGIASYDKIKLIGVLACVIGFVIMTNLHSALLYLLLHLIMPNYFP